MQFIQRLGNEMNKTTTENGAVTHLSSQDAIVDFFALAGATRNNPALGLDLFKKALAQEPLAALRVLFYFRDVRGGQGERQLFRNCLSYLAEYNKDMAQKMAQYVPEFGRYDDLFALPLPVIKEQVLTQLRADLDATAPSLLGKWMPSENTSSQKTRKMARELMSVLGYNPKQYRKVLSTLRKKISLVEQKLSSRQFGKIEYDKVPSQASLKYRKAFFRNDEERYKNYLDSVTKGEVKINTATLFPHQVYKVAGSTGAEQLWANLPDYTNGKNAIVVADVSGSMAGDPMAVSVSLALYFAERNRGAFNGHFITFSSNPSLQKINGKTLRDKVNSIERSEWGMSTNLLGVFRAVLDAATKGNVPNEELPRTIYIISDMEFDQAIREKTNFESIEMMYRAAGYEMPQLVFWNVNARNKQVPVEHNQNGVTLVSGLSPSTFKLAVSGASPAGLVRDIVNSPRYASITI